MTDDPPPIKRITRDKKGRVIHIEYQNWSDDDDEVETPDKP